MSIASQPRPGAGDAPIVPADAVDPVLPADPPIDFRLEDDDGIPPGSLLPPPADPPILPSDPVEYFPRAPSIRSGLSRRGGDDGDASSIGGSSQLPGRRIRPNMDALAPIFSCPSGAPKWPPLQLIWRGKQLGGNFSRHLSKKISTQLL